MWENKEEVKISGLYSLRTHVAWYYGEECKNDIHSFSSPTCSICKTDCRRIISTSEPILIICKSRRVMSVDRVWDNGPLLTNMSYAPPLTWELRTSSSRQPVPNWPILQNRMPPSWSIPYIYAGEFFWPLGIARQWHQTHATTLLESWGQEVLLAEI